MTIPIRPLKLHKTWTGRLLYILACMLTALFLLSWLCMMSWSWDMVPGLIYGMPVGNRPSITQRNLVPPGKLTDIAVNDDGVFLLYASAGVVNAYSHDGEAMYSIFFPKENNGSASLYANGDDLYYINRWDNIWHVQGGVYQQCWKDKNGDAKLAELKASDPMHQDTISMYDDLQYEIRGQDVYRISQDGREEILIDVPDVLAWFEFPILGFIGVLSLLTAFVLFSLAWQVEERQRKR